MSRKRFTLEQMIHKLRQAEMERAQGARRLDNLSLGEGGERSFHCHQFLERTLLKKMARLDHENPIGVLDGAEAVGDDEFHAPERSPARDGRKDSNHVPFGQTLLL